MVVSLRGCTRDDHIVNTNEMITWLNYEQREYSFSFSDKEILLSLTPQDSLLGFDFECS